MSTKDQVAAMASGLKSSAVELFKGLETTFQNREQFELALARLFSSCTGDFQAAGHDIPQRNSTLSYGENGTVERNTLGAAPLQREGSSHASSSRRPKSGSRNSSSRHSKKQGDAAKNNSKSRSSISPSRRERRQTRTDYGEHIYAQLFMDDQKRAAQTVSALRETAGGRAAPATTGPSSPVTPSPIFPASSPPRRTKITPLASDDLHIPQTPTFDDSISAISQHTLEAMDERIKQVKSTDSSLWSSLKEVKTPPLAPPRHQHHRPLSPPVMPRVRSAQSNAASSRRSRASQTTHTSDSSEFQKVWQQEEQKYWNTQVEQDSRKSRKSRNSTTQKTVDHTLPTLESSMDDVWASPLRPDAGPLARDPDRIGAVFVVPSTELAEI